jgi:molybdopterin-biosynthesis enzyme MoeA-like protein
MSAEREQSDLAGSDDTDAVEQVVEEVRDDIRHGQVEDDVSSVLEDRLTEAGVELRPETIDDLAEDIENDVSL